MAEIIPSCISGFIRTVSTGTPFYKSVIPNTLGDIFRSKNSENLIYTVKLGYSVRRPTDVMAIIHTLERGFPN